MASCSGACFSAFLFSSPCPSTAAVQGQRHPRPGGMDCVQGLVFHDELSLGWGGSWQMSPGSQRLPLLLITPSLSTPLSLLDLLGRAAFNSETPLVPPSSQGSSSQVPHLGHLILLLLLVLGTGQTRCMKDS